MEEKKSIKISRSTFFLIIAIIVIVVMGYIIYKLNDDKIKAKLEVSQLNSQIESLKNSVASMQNQIKNTSKANNSNVSNDLNTNTASTENTANNKQKSTEDTIKDLFLENLKEIDNNNEEKLVEYRVDKVTIEKDISNDILNNYKPTDILATITYSVKPKDINETTWVAGNGIVEGDWIINKSACNYLRDGELLGGLSTGW